MMAKSHREAVLAAACLQTPVHPHTRAPLPLYERLEEDRQRQAGCRGDRGWDDLISCSEDDGDQPYTTTDCKEWILDLSKIHHSDKEYYMQLERLKDAHVHNMEQLQSMYKNKLHLKGVHSFDPDVKSSFRPAWDHKPPQPDELNTYLLKEDSNWNVSSRSSAASFGEQSDGEDSCDTEASTSAREIIHQMWNGFSVQDYIKDTEPDKLTYKRKSNKSKSKEWSHRVTIPEPFEMTVRESKKKEISVKSKSEIELENNLLKKRLEEEAECQKKFRANPVPASVYLPLYQEIVERNEERRRFVKERSKEFLLASQKPFQFIERDERKKELQKMQLAELQDSLQIFKHFKARPVPKSVYDTSANERRKEEELYRDIRIHMRSQELLYSSSYPTSTLACRSSTKSRKARCYMPEEEREHRPKINKMPNFQLHHKNNQERLSKSKSSKHVTICDPFDLRTDKISSHREKILRDIEADEEHLKEARWPYKSPRSQPQMSSTLLSTRGETPSFSPRFTASSKRREKAIRKSLEERVKKEEEEKRIQARKKQREKILKKRIHRKVKAVHPQRADNLHDKLKDLRRNEKQRMEEYLQELDAMKERVSRTPLLLERVRQKKTPVSTDKHYSSLLRDLGLSDDFMTTKRQLARTDAVEHHDSTKEEDVIVNDGDDERSSQGTLEAEDLQAYSEDQEDSADEFEEENQEYSSDEDHVESES